MTTRGYDYETVDVFTSTRFGGNPLAVFVDARGLSSTLMQQIAREMNYSETTFVLPPQRPAETGADAQLRIFTPNYEVPFAGHPNIGSAVVLGLRGSVLGKPVGARIVFEETAGVVPIELASFDGVVVGATFEAPQGLSAGGSVDAGLIATLARIPVAAIVTGNHAPTIASVGLPFVMVELENLDALARVAHDSDWRSLLPFGGADAVLFYVRSANSTGGGVRTVSARARMISPLDGVGEDPATGSANAALAALLLSATSAAPELADTVILTVEQGVEMGRPSLLAMVADRRADGSIRVRVTGNAVRVMRGRMMV